MNDELSLLRHPQEQRPPSGGLEVSFLGLVIVAHFVVFAVVVSLLLSLCSSRIVPFLDVLCAFVAFHPPGAAATVPSEHAHAPRIKPQKSALKKSAPSHVSPPLPATDEQLQMGSRQQRCVLSRATVFVSYHASVCVSRCRRRRPSQQRGRRGSVRVGFAPLPFIMPFPPRPQVSRIR